MFTEDVLSKKICDLGLLNTVSTLFNESNHPPPPLPRFRTESYLV